MKRRELLALAGVTAASLVVQPGNAIAQQKPQPVKRIAILMSLAKDDPEGQARFNAFMEGLQKYGWTDGKNLRVDIRWTAGEAENIRASAAELAALAPDVILASGGTVIGPMMQATRTIPIVFTQVTDPVEAGHVSSLAHPGGNVTGFLQLEYSLSEKWLELLREISPGVKRVAVIRDPGIAAGKGLYDAIQKVAPTLGIDVVPANMRDAAEIERIVSDGTTPNSGLIVTPSALAIVRRDLIVTLAAKHRLPAVYPQRFFVAAGGLISYGPDLVDQTRQAASYVDRILKGEKPGDLPVQAPVKFDMALNLKTAKELGVEVPATVIARADEVIE